MSGKATRPHIVAIKGRSWPTTTYSDVKSLYAITTVWHCFSETSCSFYSSLFKETSCSGYSELKVAFTRLRKYIPIVNKHVHSLTRIENVFEKSISKLSNNTG